MLKKNRNYWIFAGFALVVALICSIILAIVNSDRSKNSGSEVAAKKQARVNQSMLGKPEMSENERKVARMARRATEEMRESGLLASKPGVNYTLISDDGEVTSAALEQAGIDPDRKQEVKDIVGRLWDDMSTEMSNRLVLEKQLSESGQEMRIYKIPADRIQAENRLIQFKKELRMHFGASESQILYDGLANGNYFGGFGKLDLTIKFVDADPADFHSSAHVEFTCKDPRSGQVVSGGKFVQDENLLRTHFGSIFGSEKKDP